MYGFTLELKENRTNRSPRYVTARYTFFFLSVDRSEVGPGFDASMSNRRLSAFNLHPTTLISIWRIKRNSFFASSSAKIIAYYLKVIFMIINARPSNFSGFFQFEKSHEHIPFIEPHFFRSTSKF